MGAHGPEIRVGRLGPNDAQFREAPMVEEEAEVFEEIMDDGAGVLADAFMANILIYSP